MHSLTAVRKPLYEGGLLLAVCVIPPCLIDYNQHVNRICVGIFLGGEMDRG